MKTPLRLTPFVSYYDTLYTVKSSIDFLLLEPLALDDNKLPSNFSLFFFSNLFLFALQKITAAQVLRP